VPCGLALWMGGLSWFWLLRIVMKVKDGVLLVDEGCGYG
jgi:hypothetical protein